MSGLPAFKGAGTIVGAASVWQAMSFPVGHAAGDFGILFFAYRAGPAISIPTPSGWTLIAQVNDNANPGFQCIAFYKFATSSSEPSVTLSGTTGSNAGVICTWTGVNTGTPLHSVGTGNTSAVTAPGPIYIPGGTTVLANCLAVQMSTYCTTSNAGPYTQSVVNSDLSSLATRADGGNGTASGAGLVIYEGGIATPATVQFTTATMSPNSGGLNSTVTVFLQSTDNALPTTFDKARILMTGM